MLLAPNRNQSLVTSIVIPLMLKRIVLVSLFVVASASLSVAGENLEALSGKVAAVKEKGKDPDSGVLSTVAYNLGIIAHRLTQAQADTIGTDHMLQGLDVMASVFDLYVGQDITASNSYFRRIQAFTQTQPSGTYNIEGFAGALGQLLDAILNDNNAEGAFNAFFAYVLNVDFVTLNEGVPMPEEPLEEEDGAFAELDTTPTTFTLPIQRSNDTSQHEDPFANFDDDDMSFVQGNALVDFSSR